MNWLILAILTAFFESLKDLTSKRSLKTVDEYLVIWSLSGLSLPLLLSSLLFIDIPPLNWRFWLALVTGGSLNIVAMILYIKALNLGDLSLTVPLVTFTPLFLIVTSPILVQEYPSYLDCLGIILIVFGAYLLNIKSRKEGYLAPFRALLTQNGAKLMLAVAMIWSIAANIDKLGVRNSSPIFWSIAIYSFIAIGLLPVVVYRCRVFSLKITKHLPVLLPIGIFNGLAVMLQMQAINLAMVAQVISVKRTSVLFSVFWGYLILRETGLKERAMGAIIMVIGVFVVSLL
ncbi:MAG: EamA family transporter [Gloeocapsa sp. DLM2.Bin57]|nr:MAG: EamA family transporter [Gloeocapsa sp. DLM2.Bin57]